MINSYSSKEGKYIAFNYPSRLYTNFPSILPINFPVIWQEKKKPHSVAYFINNFFFFYKIFSITYCLILLAYSLFWLFLSIIL